MLSIMLPSVWMFVCLAATSHGRRVPRSHDQKIGGFSGALVNPSKPEIHAKEQGSTNAFQTLLFTLNSALGAPTSASRTRPQVHSRTLAPQSQTSFDDEFTRFVRARYYPVLYIATVEEGRAMLSIRSLSKRRLSRDVYVWDFVTGWDVNKGIAANPGKENPFEALEYISKRPADSSGIFILLDYQKYLEDIAVSRKLRNIARDLREKTLVVLAPSLSIPSELAEMITVIDFPLPSAGILKSEFKRLNTSSLAPEMLDQFARAGQGLSLERFRSALSRCIANNGKILPEDLNVILEEKSQSIRQSEILEFYSADDTMDDIGGLDSLKSWLVKRGNAFGEEAIKYGLPYPKGLLLVGVQGTGKSLSAKATAQIWKLPLLRLDVGRLFGSYIGESEERVRKAISLAEAVAPCVFWIDEIDKAFSGTASRGDGGTTARVFGTFISWMAEKKSPVFIAATANNIEALPPELLRKGRFDEIFFVDLPNEAERREIFDVHLAKFRPDGSFDSLTLAKSTKDFSGAEIEQAVVEAMVSAFNDDGRELSTEDVLEAVQQTVPLAKTAQEKIKSLQKWAASGRARYASQAEK